MTVQVQADAEGRLTLSVHNEGDAIPAEHLKKVTQPYWRPSGAKPGQGLGLGLYICAQIVAVHGGSLEVTSTAETGTRFRVHLPARQPPRA